MTSDHNSSELGIHDQASSSNSNASLKITLQTGPFLNVQMMSITTFRPQSPSTTRDSVEMSASSGPRSLGAKRRQIMTTQTPCAHQDKTLFLIIRKRQIRTSRPDALIPKSTSRGIQFLGDKLLKLMSKKTKLHVQCLQQRQSTWRYLQVVLKTEYQLADMFTKALPEDRFKYLVRRIGMRCLTPADLEVVRLGINPMIQPEPEDLPKDNPKLEIAVLRMKKKCMDKGSKERSPPHNLRQKPGQYICCQNHKLIADIENDIIDPVMQCTTLPSHSGFSQQKLVSFVTEIHTLSIDISFRDH
ncbi:hypothetical protein Tco_0214091 [Tanacetum coccineum]